MEYSLPFRYNSKIIELGGGDNPTFHPNYDIRQLPNVDIVIDVNNVLPIQNEDCDGIYCRYCLEHLSWRRVNNFLSEIFRIIKPNGIAVFITSNLLEQAKVLVNNPKWDEKVPSMIFGDQNYQDSQWNSNAHHSGFSPEYIDRILRAVGFGDVRIIPIQTEVGPTDMIIEAYKVKEVTYSIIGNMEEENIENTRRDSITETGKNINKYTTHQFNRSYFDGEAYTGMGYQDFPVHYNTVDFIKKRDPKSVIDIGGARGYIVKRLNDQGIRATCMDISEHCWHSRATDSFILHDLTNVPWPIKDNEFDLAVSVSSLEHIPEDNIDSVIKEISRISQRGLHGITFEITPQDIDKTHLSGTIKPKEWWISKFKEISPDYPVEIVDKEEMEVGPIIVPSSPDNLVKLNIGSFINMNHYGWTNIDKLNLSDFAKQNGYIFRQEDVSNSIPYGNNSVDIITASHFLEHLDRNEGKKFLSECLRVLKPNGIIRLTVPDTELITRKYIDKSISEYRHLNVGVEKSDDDTQSLYELLLSGHKTVYDYGSLSKLLYRIGFDIQKMEFNKSNSKEIETQTIDMFPTLSLYVEATPALVYNDIDENVKQDTNKVTSTNDISKNWQIITAGKSDTEQNIQICNSDRKLRISLISTPFFTVPPKGYGGLEQVVWDLAIGLDELGHEVTIFGPEGSKATPHGRVITTGPSLSTVNVDWFQSEKNAYNVYKDMINDNDFDLVHSHTWFGFPYLLKSKYSQLKIIHTHHGFYTWESPPPFSKPNLVAISKWMKDHAEQYFRQRGFNVQSEYVHNGIDLDKYPFNPDIKRTDRLLYVGRFSRFKQPHVAIQVARRSNLPIDLVGGTFIDDVNYLKEIESMCNGDNISIYKDVPHDFKIKKMQEAKCLIFPSKMGEPLGLVAQEAMACGTAVVASRDGAIPEVVLHDRTGFVCDTEEEMVEAIKNIDKIHPFECRKRAEEFSRLKMAENYVKLYQRTLNNDEW